MAGKYIPGAPVRESLLSLPQPRDKDEWTTRPRVLGFAVDQEGRVLVYVPGQGWRRLTNRSVYVPPVDEVGRVFVTIAHDGGGSGHDIPLTEIGARGSETWKLIVNNAHLCNPQDEHLLAHFIATVARQPTPPPGVPDPADIILVPTPSPVKVPVTAERFRRTKGEMALGLSIPDALARRAAAHEPAGRKP